MLVWRDGDGCISYSYDDGLFDTVFDLTIELLLEFTQLLWNESIERTTGETWYLFKEAPISIKSDEPVTMKMEHYRVDNDFICDV